MKEQNSHRLFPPKCLFFPLSSTQLQMHFPQAAAPHPQEQPALLTDAQVLAYLTLQLDTNEAQAYVTCHASSPHHTHPSPGLRPLLAIPAAGTHRECIATLDTL